jgi:hypothetical protein
MSFYTRFNTYKEAIDYLSEHEYPTCFLVNYLPNTGEYALWIGNQPYYVYEEWMDKKEKALSESKKHAKRLQAINERLNNQLDEKRLDNIEMGYLMMKNLLIEIQDFGDLDSYDTDDIFRMIEEIENRN